MEEIIIKDYQSNPTTVIISDMSDVAIIRLAVYSGDEILSILRTDGSVEEYDSCNSRIESFFDGKYDLFNREENINRLHDRLFVNRKTSYSYFIQLFREQAE